MRINIAGHRCMIAGGIVRRLQARKEAGEDLTTNSDPHAPWQCGSNEKTNGLLHQFMPKERGHGNVNQTWCNDVAALMNNLPRKTLGWGTPAEAMVDEIATF